MSEIIVCECAVCGAFDEVPQELVCPQGEAVLPEGWSYYRDPAEPRGKVVCHRYRCVVVALGRSLIRADWKVST